jgi:hypothetical protein
MLDIRSELKERLKQNQERREQLRQELADLDATDEGLRRVLDSETAIWNKLSPPQLVLTRSDFHASSGGNGNGAGAGTLPEILREILSNGQPQTTEELKAELHRRGYPFGDKAPGRVVNFALVGMQNHDVARKLEDGRWKLIEGGRG